MGAGFTSSPWAYNGKIFVLSEDGDTYVIKAGAEFEILATNALDEFTMATPGHCPREPLHPHRLEALSHLERQLATLNPPAVQTPAILLPDREKLTVGPDIPATVDEGWGSQGAGLDVVGMKQLELRAGL